MNWLTSTQVSKKTDGLRGCKAPVLYIFFSFYNLIGPPHSNLRNRRQIASREEGENKKKKRWRGCYLNGLDPIVKERWDPIQTALMENECGAMV